MEANRSPDEVTQQRLAGTRIVGVECVCIFR